MLHHVTGRGGGSSKGEQSGEPLDLEESWEPVLEVTLRPYRWEQEIISHWIWQVVVIGDLASQFAFFFWNSGVKSVTGMGSRKNGTKGKRTEISTSPPKILMCL